MIMALMLFISEAFLSQFLHWENICFSNFRLKYHDASKKLYKLFEDGIKKKSKFKNVFVQLEIKVIAYKWRCIKKEKGI